MPLFLRNITNSLYWMQVSLEDCRVALWGDVQDTASSRWLQQPCCRTLMCPAATLGCLWEISLRRGKNMPDRERWELKREKQLRQNTTAGGWWGGGTPWHWSRYPLWLVGSPCRSRFILEDSSLSDPMLEQGESVGGHCTAQGRERNQDWRHGADPRKGERDKERCCLKVLF